jgi:hypothetical protein
MIIGRCLKRTNVSDSPLYNSSISLTILEIYRWLPYRPAWLNKCLGRTMFFSTFLVASWTGRHVCRHDLSNLQTPACRTLFWQPARHVNFPGGISKFSLCSQKNFHNVPSQWLWVRDWCSHKICLLNWMGNSKILLNAYQNCVSCINHTVHKS